KTIKLFHSEGRAFDIVFLDPPYSKGWLKKCLKCLSIYDILRNSGLIIVEHFKKEELPENLGTLNLVRSLKYGDTYISIFRKEIKNP
ncbi:MAG: RsmD family RNA methyltransferase, partial [Candidatus Omnitrophota bacterium]